MFLDDLSCARHCEICGAVEEYQLQYHLVFVNLESLSSFCFKGRDTEVQGFRTLPVVLDLNLLRGKSRVLMGEWTLIL